MNTATSRSANSAEQVQAAKNFLRAQFDALVESVSESTVLKAAELEGSRAVAAVLVSPPREEKAKALSVHALNQIAASRMKARSFENLKAVCNLLEMSEACEILGISKQALSKRAKAGRVLAYTNGQRKYFPDFQFKGNQVKPAIGKLLDALAVDILDTTQVNLLIKYLATEMDFSNVGEPANPQLRYSLIDNEAAFSLIVRDFRNRLEMGK
jgi:hypothetical protein